MLIDEAEEILALDELQLRRRDRLRGRLVGVAGEHTGEPERLARLHHARDERLAAAGRDAQLRRAIAEDEQAHRRFAFTVEQRVVRIDVGEGNGIERGQRFRIELTEETVRAPFTGAAMVASLDAIT